MRNNLWAYVRLMRLDKPIGIWLLLWPTLWALWIAGDNRPSFKLILIFVVGAVVMRSAGCVINDIADRDIDKHIERTRNRPLTSGDVSLKGALILFFCLCLIGLGLVLLLNPLSLAIAMIALPLAILYPFTKRVTYFPQFILGFSWYLGMLMAFAAQVNSIPPVAWPLYIAAALWTVAFDTQYAMADRLDDLNVGVKSTAIWSGKKDRLFIFMLQTVMITLLFIVGNRVRMTLYYYLALLTSIVLFVYQGYLTKNREPALCFKAFMNNHWVGCVIFVGVFLGLLK